MAKITFGYVSKANPFIDRKAWSGTIFKIRESIEQAGYTVRWIPYTTPFFSKFILGLYHLYAKLTGKNIVYSHIPLIARMEAHSIDKKLIAGCDMLFFSGGSQVLSRIETDKPVFYLSDATLELMVDYYWPNLAACSVRYGNSIEQRALDKASVIIHSSEWASNSARDYYHIPASKLNVIEFGANIDENKIQTPVKQEFEEKGNAKYTDIVVPKEIDDIPVVDCKSFAGHYEIKSLRVESMYSSYSNLVLSQSQEAHVASVSGCTSLEYYELPMGIRTLSEGDFKDCKALGFVRIPKDVEWIGSKTFQGCNNLKNITFDKFSNMRNADGLKTLNWWIEHKDKNGGIVYKKCFVNAGDNARKIAVRGQKVNKILENAFQSSRAKKITLENVKKLENYAMAGSQAEEIVLGKGIKIIPTGCFDRYNYLKNI